MGADYQNIIRKKFVGEDNLKPVLKNGGVCILTPAISDYDMSSYYNGFEINKNVIKIK